MVQLNKLSDDMYISGQISKVDFDGIKDAGIRSILINRPDFETKGQPIAQGTLDWAKDNGIEAVYMPMVPGQLSAELIEGFSQALANLPAPILAHCASGKRSSILWCFANAKDLGVDHVIQMAADAGYNVTGIKGALQKFAT